MPCNYDHKGPQIVLPATDHNVQSVAAQATGTPNPAIPEDHAPQTPEFLQKLIRELDDLRNKQGEVYAKMYRPQSPLGGRPKKSYQPPYEVKRELERQDRELDQKIMALKGQIRELDVLLARKKMAEPELEKASPASA